MDIHWKVDQKNMKKLLQCNNHIESQVGLRSDTLSVNTLAIFPKFFMKDSSCRTATSSFPQT